MSEVDPHNLQRFIAAQAEDYEIALQELRQGRKRSHWIWYIFPQVAGLGFSPMAHRYAIHSRDEAIAYLAHELLGPRLRECAQAVLAIESRDIIDVMGYPDNLKLRSSMTLFAELSPPTSIFKSVLDQYFAGLADQKTLDYLAS